MGRARTDDARWALSAGLDLRTAAVAAARDLLGQVQVPGADLGDPLLADLDPAALVATGPTGLDRTVELPEVLDRLRASGTDALVVAGAPDLALVGLHVGRVLLVTS